MWTRAVIPCGAVTCCGQMAEPWEPRVWPRTAAKRAAVRTQLLTSACCRFGFRNEGEEGQGAGGCSVTDQVMGQEAVRKERDGDIIYFNDRGQPFTFAWEVTAPVGSCGPIWQKQ